MWKGRCYLIYSPPRMDLSINNVDSPCRRRHILLAKENSVNSIGALLLLCLYTSICCVKQTSIFVVVETRSFAR